MLNLKFILILSFVVLPHAMANEEAGKIEFPPLPTNAGEAEEYIKKVNAEVLPKLRTMNNCLRTSSLFLEEYDGLKERVLGETGKSFPLAVKRLPGADQDYNLTRNFDFLADKQTQVLKELKEFIQTSLALSDEEVEGTIKQMDEGLKEVSSTHRELFAQEEHLIASLDHLLDYLEQLRPDREQLIDIIGGEKCKPYKSDVLLAYLHKDSNEVSEALTNMYSHTKENQVKRHRLLDLAFRAVRGHLALREVNSQVEDLQDILDQLMGHHTLERVVSNWFAYLRRHKSFSDNLDTKYLQYLPPLRVLSIRRQEVLDIQTSVMNLDHLDHALDDLKRRISVALEVIDGKINRLKENGWEYQFNRQKFFVEAYIGIQDQLSDTCQNLLKYYQEKVIPGVNSLTLFSKAEVTYSKIVDTCTVVKK